MTPYQEMIQTLRECIPYLQDHPSKDADELADRIVRLTERGRCEYEMFISFADSAYRCTDKAERIVYNRKKKKVQHLCQKHAHMTIDTDSPEYTDVCKNCGCWNPIN